MKKYVRSFAYMVVMGFFLIVDWSCIDQSPTVLEDCDWFQAPLSKKHEVFIVVIDRKTKIPISQANISYIVHEYRVIEEGSTVRPACVTRTLSSFQQNEVTESDGIFYLFLERQWNAPSEFTLLEYVISKQGYNSYKAITKLTPEHNSGRKNIYLLPVELYP